MIGYMDEMNWSFNIRYSELLKLSIWNYGYRSKWNQAWDTSVSLCIEIAITRINEIFQPNVRLDFLCEDLKNVTDKNLTVRYKR